MHGPKGKTVYKIKPKGFTNWALRNVSKGLTKTQVDKLHRSLLDAKLISEKTNAVNLIANFCAKMQRIRSKKANPGAWRARQAPISGKCRNKLSS